jgi:TolB protein
VSPLLILFLAALACNAPFLISAPSPQPGEGLIAILGGDGNLYVLDPADPSPVAVTTDARPEVRNGEPIVLYRSPAWSPDGQKLAFATIRAGDDGGGYALLVSEPAAGPPGDLREIFSSEAEAPFYLYWAPDSASLTFLTSTPSGSDLMLRQAFPDGLDARLLDTGQPYYWNWAPDAARILVHVGGSQLVNPEAGFKLLDPGGGEKEILPLAAGTFQAPARSPDGESFLAVVRAQGPADTLARFDRDGTRLETLIEVHGHTAFSWSPSGERVAVLETSLGTAPFGSLSVLDTGTWEAAWRGSDAHNIAYFWSPDGEQLAYFHLPAGESFDALARPARQDAGGLLSLSVLEIETGRIRQVARFNPTPAFLEVLPFFDQYHHSMTIWSPDGERLVFTSLEDGGDESAWIVLADGSAAPEWIAGGSLAIWSWR